MHFQSRKKSRHIQYTVWQYMKASIGKMASIFSFERACRRSMSNIDFHAFFSVSSSHCLKRVLALEFRHMLLLAGNLPQISRNSEEHHYIGMTAAKIFWQTYVLHQIHFHQRSFYLMQGANGGGRRGVSSTCTVCVVRSPSIRVYVCSAWLRVWW